MGEIGSAGTIEFERPRMGTFRGINGRLVGVDQKRPDATPTNAIDPKQPIDADKPHPDR
jgi:hypothetical protein